MISLLYFIKIFINSINNIIHNMIPGNQKGLPDEFFLYNLNFREGL